MLKTAWMRRAECLPPWSAVGKVTVPPAGALPPPGARAQRYFSRFSPLSSFADTDNQTAVAPAVGGSADAVRLVGADVPGSNGPGSG